MNAHDKRTLEQRLQWIADWSEPGIDLADAGTAREALERIQSLTAENARLRADICEMERVLREGDRPVERAYAIAIKALGDE